MRKMKKVLSLVLSLVLVCGIVAGFAACSGNKENNKKEDTTAQSDLATAELSLISAKTDYLTALSRLYVAIGEIHPGLDRQGEPAVRPASAD